MEDTNASSSGPTGFTIHWIAFHVFTKEDEVTAIAACKFSSEDQTKDDTFLDLLPDKSFRAAVQRLHAWFPKGGKIALIVSGERQMKNVVPEAFQKNNIVLPTSAINCWVNLKNAYSEAYSKKKTTVIGMVKDLGLQTRPEGERTDQAEDCRRMCAIMRKMIADGCKLEDYLLYLAPEKEKVGSGSNPAERKFNFPSVPLDKVKAQHFDYFCILDFEATCENGRKIVPQEIIEFPTVLLNAKTLEVEEEFQVYVKPTVNPRLSAFCKELTGIQQEWVDNGIVLQEALDKYHQWLKGLNLLGDSTKPHFAFITCGDWDLNTCLPSECRYFRINKADYFGQWINIKKVYAQYYNRRMGGMPEMLKGLNIRLEGRHHSGIDDCRNITKIVRKMLQDGAVLRVTGSDKRY